MVWRRNYNREEIEELIGAIERQATEAVKLAARAQEDIADDRFASFLDFRKKVEEVRALVAMTEERLRGVTDARVDDLRGEFERMDLLLNTLLVKAMHGYFSSMRQDQVLPIGARELFEPELKNIEDTRARLTRPDTVDQVPQAVLVQLDETAAMIAKTIKRAPALPDFSDSPTPPKPMKRLRNLGRPIRL